MLVQLQRLAFSAWSSSPKQEIEDRMRLTAARLDRTAAAWEAEYGRWIFRRRMDKSGWEAVRLEGDVVSEEYMEVSQIGASQVIAEPFFNSMRRRACAKAALIASGLAQS